MAELKDVAATLAKLGGDSVSVDDKGRIYVRDKELADLLASENPSLLAERGISPFIDNCECTTNNGCGKN